MQTSDRKWGLSAAGHVQKLGWWIGEDLNHSLHFLCCATHPLPTVTGCVSVGRGNGTYLHGSSCFPSRIVHLWLVSPGS